MSMSNCFPLPIHPAAETGRPTVGDTPGMRGGPREECGVFGIYAPGEEVARLTYYGLYALQHRGQESAGIAVSDGDRIVVTKDMGLVHQVFDEASLAALNGDVGVGHVRYSTAGASSWDNAQPQYRETSAGRQLALCHNGNLVNTAELAARFGPRAAARREHGGWVDNDSALMASLLAVEETTEKRTNGLVRPFEEVLAGCAATLAGAFSVVVMDERTLYAVRDAHGLRPLMIGRLPTGGYVVASESAALDIVGACQLGEVAPGEVLAIDDRGMRSRRFAEPDRRFCLFEWVYLARPDHRQAGTSVYAVRRELGRALARQAPADADLVIPVPDSGTPAAAGYAEAAHLPYAEGLVKNRYVGRTFIEPSPSQRELGIRLKLNPLPSVIEGKRLVAVDDSIVRGNTAPQLVRMLREAGAAEVHLRITSPPIVNPCYYGIDMATREELIAAGLSVDAIRDVVGADSLAYLSLDALIDAVPEDREQLCRACFDGAYPTPVPDEQTELAVDTPLAPA